jgi:thiol-disulfide isomerase/thioredoxin
MLSLQALRGKVVLVWFWSTGCAVCRDVLPELRSNYDGWHGKPFELVTVATDGIREDVVRYERIVQAIVSLKEAPPALWRRDPQYRDNFPAGLALPSAFLLDPAGRVVEQYAGRIPAQAWDRIAELLP